MSEATISTRLQRHDAALARGRRGDAALSERPLRQPFRAAIHSAARRAAVEKARGQVAALLQCGEDEVVFTSGGTESDNLAIRGVMEALPDRRQVVTSVIEHPAVAAPSSWLQRTPTAISSTSHPLLADVFFVEAHYHHSPKRAADQVRYIAHREEGLRDGERRELYGIGPRYRAFRGDERAIRKALIEDARGLRNPVYFRFILTVDNRTAQRFTRLDGRLTERVLRDAVEKTFRGAARSVQGVFAVHQHGGELRAAHPHVHALLSPRLQNRNPTHLSPTRIASIKERWETEVLRGLERQERRLEHARNEPTPLQALTPHRWPDRVPQLDRVPARARRRPLGPIGLFFLRTNKTRRLARVGGRWLDGLVRPGLRVNVLGRNPERVARRMTFRLATALAPKPIREALSALRGLRGLGLRQR